jgi:hypothetical protein
MDGRGWIRRFLPAAGWCTGVALIVGSVAWAVWKLTSSHGLSGPDEAGILSVPIGAICAVLAIPPFFGWLSDRRGVDLDRASAQLARAVRKQEGKERVRLLGNDTMAINVEFDFAPSVGRDAAGAMASGTFADVLGYYRRLRPRRMVITGEPGAGKTVLAIELMLALLADREPADPVPVRLSLPSWDLRSDLAEWLAASVADSYDLPAKAACALVDAGLLLPLLDGLDEMDPATGGTKPGQGGTGMERMAALISRLNGYQTAGQPGALVLTSRDTQYERFVASGAQRLRDAARVRIQPVTPEQAADYLLSRAGNAERWWPVCEHLVTHQESVLAQVLSTPWRLNLAFTVYEKAEDPAGLLDYTDSAALHEYLLRSYVPIVTGPGSRYPPAKVVAWLGELARYLQDNATTDRRVGGLKLSGSDIVLFELWPLGGVRRVLRWDDLLAAPAVVLAAAPVMATGVPGTWTAVARGLIPIGLFLGLRTVWPTRTWTGYKVKRARVAGWLAFALAVMVAWWFGRHQLQDISTPALPAIIIIWVLLRDLRSSTQVPQSVTRPRAAIRGNLTDGLLAGLILGIIVTALLTATTALTRSPRGWAVLVVAGTAAALLCAVCVAGLWRRYLALLLATRGRLPWRLSRFLDWATRAGLMRMAGTAYQFRHRELQEYLALSTTAETAAGPATASDSSPLPGLKASNRPAAWAVSWRGALAGTLALTAVAALSTGAVAGLRSRTSLADLAPDATATVGSMFTDLSADMVHQNEAGFLSWVAPSLRPRVALWWRNLHDVGFTGGAIGFNVTPPDDLALNSHGNTAPMQVDTGAYNARDPTSASGHVYLTMTGRYQVTIHQVSGGRPLIASWRPLDNAPWDAPVRLYVRRAAHVVVASYPDERAAADQAFARAEAAAGYTVAIYKDLYPEAVRQSGFLVFVSANPARRRWFTNLDAATRWTANPDAALAFTTELVEFDSAGSIVGNDTRDRYNAAGAARVILGPAAGTAESVSLVSAFAQAVAVDAISNRNYWFVPLPNGWGLSGFGRFVAALYQADPHPVVERYSYEWLKAQIAALPTSMLTGQIPTLRQVSTGTASQIDAWSDVAATVYAYIGARWNVGRAFFAAVASAQDSGQTPFGAVWKSYTKTSTDYYPAATVEQGWKAWLLHYFG